MTDAYRQFSGKQLDYSDNGDSKTTARNDEKCHPLVVLLLRVDAVQTRVDEADKDTSEGDSSGR